MGPSTGPRSALLAVSCRTDRDCDLELTDFAGPQECFGRYPPAAGCEVFDLNASGLVDWDDVELWNDVMTGPSE